MKKLILTLIVLSLLAPIAVAGKGNLDVGRVSPQGFMYNK